MILDNFSPRKTLEQMRIEAIAEGGIRPWKCTSCGCTDFRVTNTKVTASGNRVRLRKCRHCGEPMSTLEVPVTE